jgi:hypothetical protein
MRFSHAELSIDALKMELRPGWTCHLQLSNPEFALWKSTNSSSTEFNPDISYSLGGKPSSPFKSERVLAHSKTTLQLQFGSILEGLKGLG